MDYPIEEQEIERLKQILFPKKTQNNSRATNLTHNDSRNQNTSLNHSYNIKYQIDRLKRGIELFMQRQSQTILMGDQTITTPRQCLQLIKQMSQNLQNRNQQIEQAMNLLLQSFPKLPSKVTSHTRYFYHVIKIKNLVDVALKIKRRKYGEGMDALREINRRCLAEERREREERRGFQKRKRRYEIIRLSSGFNLWRRNAFYEKKVEIQEQITQNIIIRLNRGISLLPYEGKCIAWLQKQLQSQAQTCQILVYNQKQGTLHGYLQAFDSMGSVFETVQSNIGQNSQETERQPQLKRIQFCLEHSLSKLCIQRKKTMKIGNLKNEKDYRSIDDMICMHGYSNRENAYGCILSPLISNSSGDCIGLIRQYFYQQLPASVTQPPEQLLTKISQILQNSTKISNLFHSTKQKSSTISANYYLRALQILNTISNPINNYHYLTTNINRIIKESLNFRDIQQYGYTVIGSHFSDGCCFKLEILTDGCDGCDEDDEDRSYGQCITALEKMSKTGSQTILFQNNLFIKTQQNIYRLSIPQINRYNSNVGDILVKVLQHKEKICKQRQQEEQYNNKIEMMQTVLQRNQQIQQLEYAVKMFCMGLLEQGHSNLRDVISEVEVFVNTHVRLYPQAGVYCQQRQGSVFKLQILDMDKIDTNCIILLQGRQTSIALKSPYIHILPQHLQRSLKTTLQLIHKKLTKPQPPTNSLTELYYTLFSPKYHPNHTLQQLLQKYLSTTTPPLIRSILNNPYNLQNYLCYTMEDIDGDAAEDISKVIRKYGYLELRDVMEERPKYTVVCLDGSVGVAVRGYYWIDGAQLEQIGRIYKQMHTAYTNRLQQDLDDNYQANTLSLYSILSDKLINTIKSTFNTIKYNNKNNSSLNTHLASSYLHRTTKQLLTHTFTTLSYKPPKPLNLPPAHKLATLLNKVYLKQQQTHQLFNIYKSMINRQHRIQRMVVIADRCREKMLREGFENICFEACVYRVDFCLIFGQLVKKGLEGAFECIQRYAIANYYHEQAKQTQISLVSRISKIGALTQYLYQKYPQYSVIIQEHSENFYVLDSGQYTYTKQLPQTISFLDDDLQFPCKVDRDGPKNIFWQSRMYRQLTLTDKHYLKVLSKAIQQSYKKSTTNSHTFLFHLNNLLSTKQTATLQNTFTHLLQHTSSLIKSQQYLYRKQFYEYSIETENLKLLEHEATKQLNKRMMELGRLDDQIRHEEDRICGYRKSIVRLDLGNDKMEEGEIRGGFERSRMEMRRVFVLWRKRALNERKVAIQRRINQNATLYPIKSIWNTLKTLHKRRLQSAWVHIKSTAESQQQKLNNLQQKIHSHSKTIRLKLDNIENISENQRLMTFQDQLNYFEEENSPHHKQYSDISIIPISFKHFSQQEFKQNISVTDAEMRKINNGVYKLNPKTVKFLKRMGKINSTEDAGI